MRNKIFFISGHRDTTQEEFQKNYVPMIQKMLKLFPGRCQFVVGDYEGVDIMAQDYLVANGFETIVTVFHMFDSPRHINPRITSIAGGFKSDEERDAAMTRISDFDIAFVRKGKWGSGTAQNIKRRMELKPVYNGDC